MKLDNRIFKVRESTYLIVNINSRSDEIISFNLYNPSNKYKKLYKKLIIFLIRNTRIRFFYINDNIENLPNDINDFIDENVIGYSLYTGTPGPTQKYTVQYHDRYGKVYGYSKVPVSDLSKVTVSNEYNVLKKLETYTFKYTIIPKVIKENKKLNLYIQDSKENIKDIDDGLNVRVFKSIEEINNIDYRENKIKETDLLDKLNSINNVLRSFDDSLNTKILNLINSIKEKKIEYSLQHCDFAPWNIKEFEDKLYVFDWEFSQNTVMFYDLFHYIIMVDILVKNNKEKQIIKNIISDNYIKEYFVKSKSEIDLRQAIIIFLIYLIFNYSSMNLFEVNTIKSNKVVCKSISILQELI